MQDNKTQHGANKWAKTMCLQQMINSVISKNRKYQRISAAENKKNKKNKKFRDGVAHLSGCRPGGVRPGVIPGA